MAVESSATDKVRAFLNEEIPAGGTVKQGLANAIMLLENVPEAAKQHAGVNDNGYVKKIAGQTRQLNALQDTLQMVSGEKQGEVTHIHRIVATAPGGALNFVFASNLSDKLNDENKPEYDAFSAQLSTAALLLNQIQSKAHGLDQSLPAALVEYQRASAKDGSTIANFGDQVTAMLKTSDNKGGGALLSR